MPYLGALSWLLGDAQCSREAVLGSAGAHRVPETLIGPPGTEQDTAASRHLPALNGGAFDSSCIIPSAPTWLQQQTQQKDFLFYFSELVMPPSATAAFPISVVGVRREPKS